ncbi:MAG: glycosyl transferase, partial [Loktanella sp.]|nr:glycosyl transferase [Loktanella sp.]
KDSQASVWVVSGAWALTLFLSGRSATEVRAEAARLQQIETKLLTTLRLPEARSRRRIMTLAQFLEKPVDVLQEIVDDMGGHRAKNLRKLPPMVDLDGFAQFLQDLKNQGMHPYLTGDFPVHEPPETRGLRARKPYIVGTK